MSILGFIFANITPCVAGWFLLDLLFEGRKNFSRLEKLFLGYGLGYGCITFLMMLFSLIGVTFNINVISCFLLLPIWGVSKYVSKRSIKENSPDLRITYKVSLISLIFLIFILINVLLVFFRTYVMEYDTWDSWAIWAFKAKIFFVHKIIPLDLFNLLRTSYGHWDYPLHVPLMETWNMLWIGYWNDQLPRLIFPMFFTGLIVVLFYYWKRSGSTKIALAGTFLVSSLPGLQMWTIGTIVEPIMLFYYIAGLVLLLRWINRNNLHLLILSALFSGFAAWCKNDGILLLLCNVTVLMAFVFVNKNIKKRVIVYYFLISIFFVLPWIIIKITYGLENAVVNGSTLNFHHVVAHLNRVMFLPKLFWYHFTNYNYWNILWPLCGIFFLYAFFRIKKLTDFNYILISILLQFSVYVFLFIIWSYDLNSYVFDTLQRLLLAPALLLIMICVTAVSKNKYSITQGRTE